MSSSEPKKLENNGTRALKTTIKALLNNGFKYKGSAHAIFPQPESGTYVAYINDNIERYNNWQGTDRNDSEIVLIFEHVKHQTEIPQEILLELGYKPHVLSGHGQLVHSSGDSTAIFEKKIEKKTNRHRVGRKNKRRWEKGESSGYKSSKSSKRCINRYCSI